MVRDNFRDQRPIACAACNEGNRCGDQESEAGRQVVEHNDGLARVDEFMHHVAADIAGASRHQNRHSVAPCACGNVPADSKNCVLIAPPDGMVMAAILNDRYMSATNAPCPTSFSSRHLRSAMSFIICRPLSTPARRVRKRPSPGASRKRSHRSCCSTPRLATSYLLHGAAGGSLCMRRRP